MAAFDLATLDRWRSLAIVDRDGTTVGTIKEFYLDRETGYPTWALVNTGLFGTTQTFVPLVHATEISDGLQVPYEKQPHQGRSQGRPPRRAQPRRGGRAVRPLRGRVPTVPRCRVRCGPGSRYDPQPRDP